MVVVAVAVVEVFGAGSSVVVAAVMVLESTPLCLHEDCGRSRAHARWQRRVGEA